VQPNTQRNAGLWLALFAALAIAFFALAVSNAVYETTSPFWLTFHVLLRKTYSIVAFALVGFALSQATRFGGTTRRTLRIAISIGLYSALIELGQRFVSGARESLAQQSFDVACGIIGGGLGALIAQIFASRARRDR